jgi:hypothetical protein
MLTFFVEKDDAKNAVMNGLTYKPFNRFGS